MSRTTPGGPPRYAAPLAPLCAAAAGLMHGWMGNGHHHCSMSPFQVDPGNTVLTWRRQSHNACARVQLQLTSLPRTQPRGLPGYRQGSACTAQTAAPRWLSASQPPGVLPQCLCTDADLQNGVALAVRVAMPVGCPWQQQLIAVCLAGWSAAHCCWARPQLLCSLCSVRC